MQPDRAGRGSMCPLTMTDVSVESATSDSGMSSRDRNAMPNGPHRGLWPAGSGTSRGSSASAGWATWRSFRSPVYVRRGYRASPGFSSSQSAISDCGRCARWILRPCYPQLAC